jgi:hypothetical protein
VAVYYTTGVRRGVEKWEQYTYMSSCLDGVIDAPTWRFEYEFLPEMEKSIGGVT